jgi:hypothetical protein
MADEGEKKHDVKSFLKDIFTEDDAATIFDFVRVLAVVGGVVLMGLAIYQFVMLGGVGDIEHVGRSFMEYFAGVGAAIFGKGKSGQ